MKNIFLLDDHPAVLEGTKTMLEKDGDMRVTVGYSAAQALEILRNQSFDIMIFDLNLPDSNGIELAKQVLSFQPEACILIYTGFDISNHLSLLFEAGAVGFILKTATREQIITAIECAMRKEAVVPIHLLDQLMKKSDSGVGILSDIDVKSVSTRERDILRSIAKGKSNKEIASILLVSQRSLEYNLTELFGKLKVHSRIEAVAKSKAIGILSDEDFI